jgi:RNA recognition motif-containing protein
MGDIQPGMTEDFILKSFNHYGINPTSVKLIHDRETHELKNFCFINFKNIDEANKCILMLNGKLIPRTQIKFRLNWANYYSTFNKSIYVGNLSPDVDDISLYNLFKEKYPSVLHASVVTDKGKSKGFGFILFRGEKDYERCLHEMNGINFHGNKIKVSEQKKKEDDDKNNNSNNKENYDSYKYNVNKINGFNLINNNIELNSFNNIINSSKINKNIYNNNISSLFANRINELNSLQNEQNKYLNPYFHNNINSNNQNIINNIININTINKINNINYLNDNNNIFNKSQIIDNNNNLNSIYNCNIKNILELSNHPSFYQKSNYSNEKNDKDSLIINNNENINNFKNLNNNINNIKNSFPYKKNRQVSQFNIEIVNKYDEISLKRKIKENLDKMYNYYMEIYPGDINKLKCKIYIIIYNFFL